MTKRPPTPSPHRDGNPPITISPARLRQAHLSAIEAATIALDGVLNNGQGDELGAVIIDLLGDPEAITAYVIGNASLIALMARVHGQTIGADPHAVMQKVASTILRSGPGTTGGLPHQRPRRPPPRSW